MLQQSRRDFLNRTVLGGAGLLILSNSRSARAYAANERLGIALVGVGGRGKWHVDVIPKQANLVALCDVNDNKAQAATTHCPTCPGTTTFASCSTKHTSRSTA